MNLVTIAGARRQVKKAPRSSLIWCQYHSKALAHTGQHYDDAMSTVFFRELALPDQVYNLGKAPRRFVGSVLIDPCPIEEVFICCFV